jgi:pimeloyl-ACP methyl ester carboxylesterase
LSETDGPPRRALFVHGAGAGGWEWNLWSGVFAAEGYAVAAPDLLPDAMGLAATQFEYYLEQVIAAGAGASVLIGASLGGLLALKAVERLQPRALVLVNPLPPGPLSLRLPPREPYPEVVPWGRDADLAGTRRALPDADEATCLHAFRRWRDESGAVLNAARAGIECARPACPVLVLASTDDEDVPVEVSLALAAELQADALRLRGASHVGALLGNGATAAAEQAVAWLNMNSC